MPDKFFTPTRVARRLISFFRTTEIESVADFAAGNGELLRAARERWPSVKCFATEIDQNCVSRLRRWHSDWSVGKCDFLSQSSRARSSVLNDLSAGLDLVLLNPPFSCRGNAHTSVELPESSLTCSTAMAFVLHSLDFLAEKGRLVAVLPSSCHRSQKDKAAWSYIEGRFDIRTVAKFGVRTFPNCAANTLIVRLQHLRNARKRTEGTTRARTKSSLKDGVTIVRGCVPMHSARNGWAGDDYNLVHTTDMNRKNITHVEHQLRVKKRSTVGPSVLIPRVGQPSKAKCVLYLGRKPLVLSDCVYALRCGSSADAHHLQRLLMDNWDIVSGFYGGTCAPYITVRGLLELLRHLGVRVSQVDATGKI